MAIRKYTNGAWVPTGRKFGTETDTITSLPAQIIGDGQAITSCQISGNTLQDGTPTPSDPVDVVGCGVRTGNLFDGYLELGSINGNDGTDYQSTIRCMTNYIGVIQNKAYTVSVPIDCLIRFVAFYGDNKEFLGYNSNSSNVYTFDTPSSTKAIRIVYGYKDDSPMIVSEFPSDKIMLNLGSTAMPYEPYGFKLPLTVNGTEYPIYLGQVETTRKIYKMRLVNPLSSTQASNGYRLTFNSSHPALPYQSGGGVCNIARWNGNYNQIGFVVTGKDVFITQNVSEWATKDSATRWFEENEVYIWYVLAKPETAVVNEPLMKIGDYADTVSVTSIPTTGTPENFDVLTTLKPSEVQLTYHGWHEHDDTKYTQGE